MLEDLVDIVNFNENGAFIEHSPRDSMDERDQHSRSVWDRRTTPSASEGSNVSASLSGSDPVQAEPPTCVFSGTPSFEFHLAVPRNFVAGHALYSSMDTTLMLDLARLAIEMDAIVECALEQLLDRQQLALALNAVNPSAGASLNTSFIVLLRQASQRNTMTLIELLQRFQHCVTQLFLLRYPLAQCIDSNLQDSSEFGDGCYADSRRFMANVEICLLDRLDAILDSVVDLKMTPLVVPKWTQDRVQTQTFWPNVSSFVRSASSPSRILDDVRLRESSISYESPPSTNASASLQPSSSTTQTDSMVLSTTPVKRLGTGFQHQGIQNMGSASSSNDSSKTIVGSANGDDHHSQY